MDKDLARKIIRTSFLAGSELQSLIGPLKAQCSAGDYKYFTQRIAMAIDGVHVALVDTVLARFPELEKEMDVNLAKTGKTMP